MTEVSEVFFLIGLKRFRHTPDTNIKILNGERMGNDILDGILRLLHTKLLILLLKYIHQVTEKCIHNAGVGGSSPPVATNIIR